MRHGFQRALARIYPTAAVVSRQQADGLRAGELVDQPGCGFAVQASEPGDPGVGFSSNGVRYLGNLLAGHGMSSAAVGAYELGPIGAAAPAVGAGFKKLGAFLTNRQVSQLDQIMRSRSPDALPKITNPLNDWNNATEAFRVSPVPRNLARVSIASRNLANNLGDVGINLSPENLIRSVLRPSAANEATPNE
jgi:hypothetical protein